MELAQETSRSKASAVDCSRLKFSHRFDKHKTEIDSISRDSRVFILDFTKNDVSEKTLRNLGMVSMDGIDLDVQLNAALKAKATP